MADNHTMSFPTAQLIKNQYPENIEIRTIQIGNMYRVDVYLLSKKKIVQHLLTSKSAFRSSGEAKLHAEIVCESIVNDQTLLEV